MSEQLETTSPITAHEDPDGQAPWAMQLIVLVDKANPPTRTAACQATATAVVTLLADASALPAGPWFPAIDRWTDGRIRKHCRRARGSAWDKVQNLPGVTVQVDGVAVRAFVPGPVDQIPRDIAKLQLSGTELEDPEEIEHHLTIAHGPVVVSICPEPFLPFGKAAAAAGHAAQLVASQMDTAARTAWASAGFPVAVEHPTPAHWAARVAQAQVRIVDAGFTAVPAGTMTAVARWA